jgi:hypothetical protein
MMLIARQKADKERAEPTLMVAPLDALGAKILSNTAPVSGVLGFSRLLYRVSVSGFSSLVPNIFENIPKNMRV